MFGKKLVDARAYNAMVKELAVLRADGLDEATELASFEWHARKVNDFMQRNSDKVKEFSDTMGWTRRQTYITLMYESKRLADNGFGHGPCRCWDNYMSRHLGWLVFVHKSATLVRPEAGDVGAKLPPKTLGDIFVGHSDGLAAGVMASPEGMARLREILSKPVSDKIDEDPPCQC